MRRAQLGDLAVLRIRRAARLQVRHHDLLVRDDHEEHVGRHDRRGECAQVQQRRPAAEHVGVAPGHHHQDHEQDHHQQCRPRRQPRLAEVVVEQPAHRQRQQREHDRPPDRNVEHRAVDQEQVGAGIIDDGEHGEARQPGRVALPLEPGQVLGHVLRRHQVLLDVVEPAAVDLPFLAIRPGRQVRHLLQAEIERDEVERRPDPGDGRDHMQPARRECEPVPDYREFVHPGASRSRSDDARRKRSRRICCRPRAVSGYFLKYSLLSLTFLYFSFSFSLINTSLLLFHLPLLSIILHPLNLHINICLSSSPILIVRSMLIMMMHKGEEPRRIATLRRNSI